MTFRHIFGIFPLFFIKFARFIQKTPTYRLLLLHPLLRQEPHFRSQKYSSASQGRWPGGPEGFHAHTSSAWQTKNEEQNGHYGRAASRLVPLQGGTVYFHHIPLICFDEIPNHKQLRITAPHCMRLQNPRNKNTCPKVVSHPICKTTKGGCRLPT